MAVAIMQDWAGATLDQYDQVNSKLDSTSVDGKGALSHWVAKSDTGIIVVDVWATREAFQKFADEQLIPTSKEVGFPNPPTFKFHEVHNCFPKDSS